MTQSKPAGLIHLVVVHGPQRFQGDPVKMLYLVASGTRETAAELVLEHLGHPEGGTAELSPDRLTEDEVRSMNVRAGEIRELSSARL